MSITPRLVRRIPGRARAALLEERRVIFPDDHERVPSSGGPLAAKRPCRSAAVSDAVGRWFESSPGVESLPSRPPTDTAQDPGGTPPWNSRRPPDRAEALSSRLASAALAPATPPPGPDEGGAAADIVVMDDFLYGEPQEIKQNQAVTRPTAAAA